MGTNVADSASFFAMLSTGDLDLDLDFDFDRRPFSCH